MTKRNPSLKSVEALYLFYQLKKHIKPTSISLGVGDTSLPLFKVIGEAIAAKALALTTKEGYSGYGQEQGELPLRKRLSEVMYQGKISPDEIFISDGAKCDLGRLQILFGKERVIAQQDPAYPVYKDSSLIMHCKERLLLPCTPENNFFPDLSLAKGADLLFFCAPNNPTGAVYTKEQLEELVSFAKKEKCILLFDAAYSFFADGYPRSIYEIPSAQEVAIEVGSFSKLFGFSGVRLGWTVIPKALHYSTQESLHEDFSRIVTTFFNGASNLSQAGGLAALSDEGMAEMKKAVTYYKKSAELLKEALQKRGFEVYGGDHSPFLWVKKGDRSSSELFFHFLEVDLVTTPGVGFGPSGEGFVRLSALGKREEVEEACRRICQL